MHVACHKEKFTDIIAIQESLKIFDKWSVIFRKSSKTLLSVCIYNKQSNTCLLVDMEYLFLCSTFYVTSVSVAND